MACCMSATGSFQITSIQKSDIAEAVNKLDGHYETQMKKANETWDKTYQELCIWAKPVYGDPGESLEKTLWQAAMLAVALLNSIAQMQIADMQHQIAKDYANIAKDQWSRFRDGYAPLEQAMLNEVCNTPIPVPDYERAFNDGVNNAQAGYTNGHDQLTDLAKSYALCVDPTLLDDLDYAESMAQTDGVNYNYRYEEYYAKVMDDMRWNRRSNLLNLGRGIQAKSASYASTASDMLKGVGNMLNQGTQGAMTMLGWLANRNQTQYPTMMSGATALNGQAGNTLGNVIAMGPVP